jgi:hypothetical protein
MSEARAVEATKTSCTRTGAHFTLTSSPYVEAADSHGWHVLLGENIGGKILCVDFFPGEHSEFFRQLGSEVHSLDLSTITDNFQRSMLVDTLSQILESELSACDGKASFDGFVVHDLTCRILGSITAGSIRRLLLAVFPLLKPGGFCYLGFPNANALFDRRQSGAVERGKRLLGPGAVYRDMVRAGFIPAGIRLHAYLLESETILEILPSRGYTSVKNSIRLRERVKEWCYGRFGARRWAPAYGAIAFKDHTTPSIVERLANQLNQLPEFTGENLQMVRCQVLWRKLIFSFGTDVKKYGQLVVVYSRDPQTIARREAESEVLGRLAHRLPALRKTLPQLITHGTLGVYRYFALSEFAGMTIDRPCPGTEIAKRNAVSWLIMLHRSTAVWCKSSPELFDDLVLNIFGHAIKRYPELQKTIEQIRRAVQHRGAYRDWLAVWQHGDYKLENLILDPRSLEVVGVIDWELSRELGLPLLDILYLIVYDRNVNQMQAQENVYLTEVLPWKFAQDDELLLNEYLTALGLIVDDRTLWAAIYLIHNIGVRRHYSIANPQHFAILKKMLDETAKALDSSPFTEHQPSTAAGVSE